MTPSKLKLFRKRDFCSKYFNELLMEGWQQLGCREAYAHGLGDRGISITVGSTLRLQLFYGVLLIPKTYIEEQASEKQRRLHSVASVCIISA